jgi:hypothetical protein
MIFANLIIALGWPAKLRLCVGLRALLLVLFIYPAVKSYGMAGAAGLLAAANLLTLGSQILMVRKQIGLRIFDYLSGWKGGVVCSIGVFILIFAIEVLLPGEGTVHLIFRIAVCGIVILAGLKWQAISRVFCRRGNAHTDLGKEINA